MLVLRSMSETATMPRPSAIFKQMSTERRREAADAFWRSKQDPQEQAEVVALIAQRLKFRTKSVVVLPVEKKTQYLLGLLSLPEMVAARLLVAYHIAHQRPLMAAFLDALGVKHDNGMIADDTDVTPTPEQLRTAVGTIAPSFPKEDVAVYLSTLYWQNTDTWGPLAEMPETAIPPRQ
jgi:hypothetical protein